MANLNCAASNEISFSSLMTLSERVYTPRQPDGGAVSTHAVRAPNRPLYPTGGARRSLGLTLHTPLNPIGGGGSPDDGCWGRTIGGGGGTRTGWMQLTDATATVARGGATAASRPVGPCTNCRCTATLRTGPGGARKSTIGSYGLYVDGHASVQDDLTVGRGWGMEPGPLAVAAAAEVTPPPGLGGWTGLGAVVEAAGLAENCMVDDDVNEAH